MVGEFIARKYLERKGYAILEKNYRSRYGEIDLIAQRNNDLIFLEVKTRTSLEYGDPLEAVGKLKISRIRKSASFYMAKNCFLYLNPHFDVISIVIDRGIVSKAFREGSLFIDVFSSEVLKGNKNVKIEYIENAF